MSRDRAANQLTDYKTDSKTPPGVITTASGTPVAVADATLSVGPRGPLLLQDFQYTTAIQHFNRERIPERVVSAKGAGAFGYFELTHDISKYCAASIFAKVKKRTPICCRFSTFMSEKGSADTVRDLRGFAVKFYTEQGIWDVVGQNLPVFFIRDPMSFPSFVHSQKRNPQTHLRDVDMFWDFATLRQETLHALCLMFGDRGCPDGYRRMHGYGVHAYKMINAQGEPIFCKFHFRTDQGIQNIEGAQMTELLANDLDYAARDLYNSIKNANYPSWTMFLQLMTFDQAKKFKYNPFDATKIWCLTDFPLMQVGKLVLDRNATNYFAEIEQLAFSPANMIPGIEPSPDKILQGRLFAYADAQRHRLGANYNQIPINCPYRISVQHYERDGPMTVNNNMGEAPNYYPNSFGGPKTCEHAKALQTCSSVVGDVYRYDSVDSENNYGQATDFWVCVLDECARKRLVYNIAAHLSGASSFIQERAVRNFTMIHVDFGRLLKEALDMAQVGTLCLG
ncbi:catalase-like [Stomoxys calcitrans]|uniref:catalase-like n=1 Tax=Stomoxys calcitrans TaxID=35570 RepID=UPI0027E3025B|nr:catalase-like [Stomoxys calcitrans]